MVSRKFSCNSATATKRMCSNYSAHSKRKKGVGAGGGLSLTVKSPRSQSADSQTTLQIMNQTRCLVKCVAQSVVVFLLLLLLRCGAHSLIHAVLRTGGWETSC